MENKQLTLQNITSGSYNIPFTIQKYVYRIIQIGRDLWRLSELIQNSEQLTYDWHLNKHQEKQICSLCTAPTWMKAPGREICNNYLPGHIQLRVKENSTQFHHK